MADPLRYFRVEAREILEQLQSGLLEAERAGAEEANVARLLRQAHTLKGAARVVKEQQIAQLAHQLEDELVPLRGAPRALTPAEGQRLLTIVDGIADQLRQLAPAAPSEKPAAGESVVSVPQRAERPARDEAPRVDAAPLEHVESLMAGVTELGFQLSNARLTLSDVGAGRSLAERLTERLDPKRRGELRAGTVAMLRGLASELDTRLTRVERELSTSMERAARELGQVKDRVDQLRLVAASQIFGTLERATRDAAVSVGKRALFEARGGELRLDADVLSAVQRALLQAVRNAVAHGIEPSAERLAQGKPEQGRITLDIERRGRQVSFLCRDDGRGVNLTGVRAELKRLGRLAPSPQDPSDEELLAQLMQGGVSTSRSVSEVAGRGVGLDLIREALAGVGGRATLRTKPGAGTSLELHVPASLSAFEALLVETTEQVSALPLGCVVKAARLASSELQRTADSRSLIVDGQVVPFVPLARLLKAARWRESERTTWSVVVIRAGAGLLALGVDRLCGSENVVARALPESARVDSTVLGVTLDVEGNPRLLLDPDGLLLAARSAPVAAVAAAPRRRLILVVDDSLTTRMLEQSILESSGYEVALATSGEQGLQLARQRAYDLFLVDVEMPGMDGFTFIEQVRADPSLAHTPAVLVTSRASAADVARGKAAGASGHIDKGEFDQLVFLAQIDRLMR